VFRDKKTQVLWVYTSIAWLLVIVLVVSFGFVYRSLASHLKVITQNPVLLPIPLGEIPLEIGPWKGKEVPIPINIQRSAANDDFANRLYVNESSKEWVNIYVAYTARPRTMLGHRPQVCYPASGWVHDSSRKTKIVSKFGTEIPCLIHSFHTPLPQYEQRVVLNYYIVNGRFTSDESVFSGLGWRTPNIAGDPARYAAQIQISSALESSVLSAAEDTADLLADYFPDKTGQVKAERMFNPEPSFLNGP
jgi:hypothetical protein